MSTPNIEIFGIQALPIGTELTQVPCCAPEEGFDAALVDAGVTCEVFNDDEVPSICEVPREVLSQSSPNHDVECSGVSDAQNCESPFVFSTVPLACLPNLSVAINTDDSVEAEVENPTLGLNLPQQGSIRLFCVRQNEVQKKVVEELLPTFDGMPLCSEVGAEGLVQATCAYAQDTSAPTVESSDEVDSFCQNERATISQRKVLKVPSKIQQFDDEMADKFNFGCVVQDEQGRVANAAVATMNAAVVPNYSDDSSEVVPTKFVAPKLNLGATPDGVYKPLASAYTVCSAVVGEVALNVEQPQHMSDLELPLDDKVSEKLFLKSEYLKLNSGRLDVSCEVEPRIRINCESTPSLNLMAREAVESMVMNEWPIKAAALDVPVEKSSENTEDILKIFTGEVIANKKTFENEDESFERDGREREHAKQDGTELAAYAGEAYFDNVEQGVELPTSAHADTIFDSEVWRDMLPVIIEQSDQFKRYEERQHKWVRVPITLSNGETLDLHMKLGGKNLQIKFSDRLADSMKSDLMRGWQNIAREAHQRGLDLQDPIFS